MQEAVRKCPRDTREDLIDSLIAMSLLTQRMARSLIRMTHSHTATTMKGGNRYGTDERAGQPAYRLSRA